MMTEAERLAAYDRMYADLLKERDKVLADMDKLRAAGRNRGTTYQQLLAQKLTVQNLIGRFEIYGIKEVRDRQAQTRLPVLPAERDLLTAGRTGAGLMGKRDRASGRTAFHIAGGRPLSGRKIPRGKHFGPPRRI